MGGRVIPDCQINMNDTDIKRLARLTSILISLQSKKLFTAKTLAEKFNVTVRTIYRDIRSLEQAGVPVLTEEGKGYTLMEGYKVPPVMFTESEANALITAEQLVIKNKDASFVREYTEAVTKIKAVLRSSVKDKVNLLSERLLFRQNINHERTSNYLSLLQSALTNFLLIEINYRDETGKGTVRKIEPFALYSTQDNWILIAFCKLRKDFRAFRLDRIESIKFLDITFSPHKITLQEYFNKCAEKYF